MKFSRIILIVLLFVVFFEIGIFCSYTIVNAEVPNPGELIEMQVNTVSSFFSTENVGGLLIKDPDEINITNKYDLAEKLSDVAEVDGVNVDNMTVTTSADTDEEPFNATVTAYGYSTPKGNSGSIVISGEPDYKITASVAIKHTINGFEADLDTIHVDSILKVYDSNDAKNTTSYSGYDSGASGSSKTYSYSSSSSGSGNNYYSSSSSYDSGSSSGSSSYDSGSSSGSSSYDSGSSSSSDGSSSGDVVINLLTPIFSFI